MINPAETLKQRFLTVPALPYMNEFASIDHSLSACKIFVDLILPMVSCYSHIYLENYENSRARTHTHTHTLCLTSINFQIYTVQKI